MIAQTAKPRLIEPKPAKPKETRVSRRLVPMIGLSAVLGIALLTAPARAQVNIDQGKSPSEMFSGDCATCHKSAKGLANGRNSTSLASFLREHYTSSAQQASSLAAYVLGAGSGPAPSGNMKPGTGDTKAGEAKPGDKTGDKTRGGRPEPASTARVQPPTEQDTKIEAEPGSERGPGATSPAGSSRKQPAAGKREPRPVTASRGPRQEPETPPSPPEAAPVATPEPGSPVATPEPGAPAPVATAPAMSEPPSSLLAPLPPMPEPPSSPLAPPQPATAAAPAAIPESSSPPAAAASSATAASPELGPSGSAGASAEAPSSEAEPAEAAPVPRDDIPD
jgi:hypothetical protein